METRKVQVESKWHDKKIVRQARLIEEVIAISLEDCMKDGSSHWIAGALGVRSALKRGNGVKDGLKTSVATYGAIIGIRAIINLGMNANTIRKA